MDIVERLRSWFNYDLCDYIEPAIPDIREAADEIERLRQQNAELERALQFYADEKHYETTKVWTTSFPQYEPDGYKIVFPVIVDNGVKARAAIAKATGDE